MIFDGKNVDSITDGELLGLVSNHASERVHLEFKLTINNKNDEDKLEALLDIASLANAKGGYLIVGIRDDGKGRAQKFEPEQVGDVLKIATFLRDLCLEHISERIDDLEIVPRTVNDCPLVIVRVPESLRRPHMVTFHNNTLFYTRYESGKRAMTIGEIRERFTRDEVGTKLVKMEATMAQVLKKQDEAPRVRQERKDEINSLLILNTGDEVSDAAQRRFFAKNNSERVLWMAITPHNVRDTKVDVESQTIINLLENPPGSRSDGWNMQINNLNPQRFVDGIFCGTDDFARLELCENGHMEFKIKDDNLFFWKQSEEEMKRNPRLWPYVVIEFPTSFLRLYRAVAEAAHIRGNYIFRMMFTNLQGVNLPERMPVFPSGSGALKQFPNVHFEMPPFPIDEPFNPDEKAFEVLKRLYASFGHTSKSILFYKPDEKRFEFPS